MSSLVLPEYYADLAQTTLSSNYTAASGSMIVTSAAALSTTRQFHFMITDQSTGAVKVIGKATAVSSNTFTIVATTDANAVSGDFVTITLCAAAEDQIRSDCSQLGPFSGLPTVAKAGDRYKQTDGPYEWIYTGSVWQAFWNGYAVTLPPSGGWTSEGIAGQSGSFSGTVNYTNGYGFLITNSNSAPSVGVQYKAAPSTPYGFVARWQADYTGISSSLQKSLSVNVTGEGGFAIGFRDSGGKYVVFVVSAYSNSSPAYITIYKFSANNTFASDVSFLNNTVLIPMLSMRDLVFKIHNDGTNISFLISPDGGNNFYTYHTEAITAYLADADNVCWGGYTNGDGSTIMLYDWTQTT